jgi:hypothetical protein
MSISQYLIQQAHFTTTTIVHIYPPLQHLNHGRPHDLIS